MTTGRPTIIERTTPTEFGPGRLLEAGAAGRPTLLLVHGYAAAADQWRPLMTHLAGDYHLVAFDLLGFGAAPAPAPPYTVERWLDQIETLLDGAAAPVVLVGHSLGGLIAAEAARRWPARVRALALLCPFGVLPPLFAFGTRGPARPVVDRLRHSGAGEALVRGLRLTQAMLAWPLAVSAFYRPFDAPAEAVTQWRWLINRPGAELALLDVVRRIELLETGLQPGEITEPAVIIWGRQDRLLPVSLAVAWQQRLPQAPLMIVERCGHLPHVEGAAIVAEQVRRLIERTLPTG